MTESEFEKMSEEIIGLCKKHDLDGVSVRHSKYNAGVEIGVFSVYVMRDNKWELSDENNSPSEIVDFFEKNKKESFVGEIYIEYDNRPNKLIEKAKKSFVPGDNTPTDEAWNAAKLLVKRFLDKGIEPHDICPAIEEGVEIAYIIDSCSVEIIICNDGGFFLNAVKGRDTDRLSGPDMYLSFLSFISSLNKLLHNLK